MDNNGVHIRDRIELSPQLIKSFSLTTIKSNQTEPHLMFIGREIILKGGTTQIEGFRISIIADTLNVEGDSRLLVKALDNAADNTSGAAAPQVDIHCRNLQNIRVRAQGGQGGRGLPYAAGEAAPGADGRAGEECIRFNQHGALKCKIEMSQPPGRGAKGKPGSKGGTGGRIRLSYVHNLSAGSFNAAALESAGGLGGSGGPGGPGGCTIYTPYADPEDTQNPPPPDVRRCEGTFVDGQNQTRSYRGLQGSQGSTGSTGDSIAPQVTQTSEEDYWSQVNSVLGAKSKIWAEQRLQAAEYYHRTFDPIARPTHLGIALAELKAVAQLNPAETRTALYRDLILNNLNVLGHDRTLSLIPDFDHYYQILANHEPDIRNIFFAAASSLLHEADLGLFKADVQARADHLKTLIEHPESELNRDLAEAKESVTNADKERKAAEVQRDQVESQIRKLEEDINLNPAEDDTIFGIDVNFKLFAGVALTVIGSAVLPGLGTGAGAAIAGSLFSFGKQLVGNPAAVNTVTSILENSISIGQNIETELGKLSSGAKGISDYIPDFENYLKQAQGDSKAAIAKLKEQLEQQWNKAEGLVHSFTKIEQELSSAKPGNDPRQIQVVNHYRELAALTQQQLQAELRFKQANLSVRKAEVAIEFVKQDLNRLQGILNLGNAYQQVLKTDTLKVIRAAQVMQSRLLTFIFRAARALQIFTLSSDSQIKVRYDYGYLHPDIEQDYLEGQILPAEFRSALLKAILPKGATGEPPVDSLGYAEFLERYKNRDPAHNIVLKERIGAYSFDRLSIALPIYEAAIAAFKASQKLNFIVHPEPLWPNRFDEKIASVAIKLIGVKAGPTFSCIVRQGGRTAQRRLPSGNTPSPVVYSLLNPSRDVILMRLDPQDPTQTTYVGEISVTQAEDATTRLGCWGRGVAAEWTVEIESGTGAVNLAQLTDVEVQIEYDGFAPDQSSLQQIAHTAGTMKPGTTASATVTLIGEAPAAGRIVQLTSSHPNLVRVPGTVTVPAGLATATFPIQVADNAANATVILTATADFTVRTRLFFPPTQAPAQQQLSLGTKSGFNSNVYGIASPDKYVYATHYYSKIENSNESFGQGELVVIDSTTFKEVANARIQVGLAPRSVVVNPLTRRLYVMNRGATIGSNQQAASLSVIEINPTDASKLKEITQLSLGAGLVDVTVNTQTNRVYVTNGLANKIHVINGATHQELQSIQLPSRPNSIVVNEKDNRLYVTLSDRAANPIVNAIAVVKIAGETGDQTQIEIIPIHADPTNPDPTRPTQPADVAFNPETNRLYVANLGGVEIAPSCVTVIDLATGEMTTVKTIAGARAISLNPKLNQIYIGTDAGVQIMNGATKTIVNTISGKTLWGIAVNPTTNQAYAGSATEGTVIQIVAPDLSTRTQWT